MGGRMRRRLLYLLVFLFVFANCIWATTFTGSISGDGGGLFGTNEWDSENVILSWDVTNPSQSSSGFWEYMYTFTVPSKGISHLIIEVSDFFTAANILEGTTEEFETGEEPQLHTTANGNPGIPDSTYGIKWAPGEEDPLSYSWTLVSNIEPIWCDFYAKSGGGQEDPVIAYNAEFSNAMRPVFDPDEPNPSGWVLVPDSTPIPEPATMLLIASGLIGLAGFGRKKFLKKS
jgi:hypothetical protein